MLLDLEFLVKKYNMDIKGVIHIGAHFGEENNGYNNLKLENRIFFEPLEKNYKKHSKRVSDFRKKTSLL